MSLHLIIGPVGAGKSTFARTLSEELGAVRLTLDAWMATLYGDDERPPDRMAWYGARVERCLGVIRELASQLVAVGTPVILEIGLIQREARERFYAWVDANAYALSVYVVDAPREVRRARVLARNAEQGATFSMVVPEAIFELASDLWEPPEGAEVEDRAPTFVPMEA